MTGSNGAELPEQLLRVHMIGIGGAGMSGIARILIARGAEVSGSDAKESRVLLDLRARGASVRVGHDASALDLLEGGPTLVVSTEAAIKKDNPELLEAHRRGIPTTYRPDVLAQLMQGSDPVLVAGTHGKTSTTSLLVVALQHCHLDPSFAVGGELNEAGTNAHHGTGGIFVAEADESDGSLLRYEPRVAIVTNVEADHLDYYGSAEAYVRIFDSFADRVIEGGVVVACIEDPGAHEFAVRTAARGIRVIGYGSTEEPLGDVELGAELLGWEARDGGGVGRVRLAGIEEPLVMRLAVPGRHMALNALAALLAAREIGAPIAEVLEGLEGFGGVRRRFQYVGREAGVRLYDDYAHHPTEVRAVLRAAQDMIAEERAAAPEYPTGKVVVIFQPHMYSRTEIFATEFAAALDLADEVIVLDVYGAREEPRPGVTGELIARQVTRPVHYQPDVSELPVQVARIARPGDLVLTMGAGDVTMLGPVILDGIRSRRNLARPGEGAREGR
ncbi:UDP-N-acetylmuramate--L-alanine ligase [Hoyosella sp. G463]|uniref:UDP-N-acetylmuramate--L-alanine ligase n=1 Tax=Lolliginicoccus lacisalsi TaxID=2742202 RepID=A0A927JEQ7_9ACTN|nr:UDP-N-acetylmuramate--L-alanine ligase [Lolliginicoccus lacisalsi]MBD8507763.1 UDP-N-acetylmuramate--L-alanine ligase [Lolliginicoccus lacisalsi]